MKNIDKSDKDNDDKTDDKRCQMNLQRGSWRMKVPLGRVLPKGVHSCPMGKDKHLAAS